MGNRLSEAAIYVPASEISPALIGATFGHPISDSWFYGKIAAVEVRSDDQVRLTVSDVQVPGGGSLVVHLAASESIWIELEHAEGSVISS
jgi:hypothetical protein